MPCGRTGPPRQGRRGIVAIWQQCGTNTSVSACGGSFFSSIIAGMTSADTSAAHFDTAPADEPRRWSVRRWLAPFAVVLALGSAFLTFVVLTGLTTIEPTPEIVRSFYLMNAATILLLVGIIIRELWQMIVARRR